MLAYIAVPSFQNERFVLSPLLANYNLGLAVPHDDTYDWLRTVGAHERGIVHAPALHKRPNENGSPFSVGTKTPWGIEPGPVTGPQGVANPSHRLMVHGVALE